MSWNAALAIGSLSLAAAQRRVQFPIWSQLFSAFEAGAFAMWIGADTLYVAEIPTRVAVDDRRRLHCADGHAFAWLSDIRDAYWHGVNVPEHVVLKPETITLTEIKGCRNTEVRRVMIERYGQARYLLDSGATRIHADDYGTLYRQDLDGDEPLVMVKVVNSTAEPDGSFKDYFLRVPPTFTTARAAVAWTFGLTAEEYAPSIQT